MRLKGGDPFVFGRGGEEAEALRGGRHRVRGRARQSPPASRRSAYAGIPVTHRDAASAVAFVTGHEDPDKAEEVGELDWTGRRWPRSPARWSSTWGCGSLRGDRRAADGGRTLAGRAGGGVERGTLPDQRVVSGTLATIAGAAQRRAAVRAPAIRCLRPGGGAAPSAGLVRGAAAAAAGPSR